MTNQNMFWQQHELGPVRDGDDYEGAGPEHQQLRVRHPGGGGAGQVGRVHQVRYGQLQSASELAVLLNVY